MIVEVAKHGTIISRDHESIKLRNKEEYIEIPIEKIEAIIITANALVSSQVIKLCNEKRHIMRVQIEDYVISLALKKLEEVKKMFVTPLIPNSNFDKRCLGCAYVKICPVGSLNIRQ